MVCFIALNAYLVFFLCYASPVFFWGGWGEGYRPIAFPKAPSIEKFFRESQEAVLLLVQSAVFIR
jgi:hypothetical protein